MLKKFSFSIILGFTLTAICLPDAQAQLKDDWIKDVLEKSEQERQRQKSQNSYRSGTYSKPPPSPKPKEDWGALANTFGQIFNEPHGETQVQRQQRLNSAINNITNINQDYDRQQYEYQRSQSSPDYRYKSYDNAPRLDHGRQSSYDDYARERERRQNLQRPTSNSGKRQAGYSQENYEQFLKKTPRGGAIGSGFGRNDYGTDIDDLDASSIGILDVVEDEKRPTNVSAKTCQCYAGDHMLYGICRSSDPNSPNYNKRNAQGVLISTYPTGYYPWTPACLHQEGGRTDLREWHKNYNGN